MSADRFYLSQSGHVALLLAPVDATGGKSSACFNFSKYSHASIIVGIGVSAAAPTGIIVEACTAQSGTGNTAIPFNVYKAETAGGDVLGPVVTCTASGFVPSANDGIFYVIELDSAQIPSGFNYVRVTIQNGANSVISTIVAVLSGARYAGDQSPTVLA